MLFNVDHVKLLKILYTDFVVHAGYLIFLQYCIILPSSASLHACQLFWADLQSCIKNNLSKIKILTVNKCN